MYGPPGTGKTTLAEYVADRLERELVIRSAPELLGMFVGETEKTLARMFLEAGRSGAVAMCVAFPIPVDDCRADVR